MTQKIIGAPRSRRRHRTLLLCLVAVLGVALFAIAGAQSAPPDTAGFFELDKNATNDLTVSHLGALKSQIRNATDTTITVCERAPTLAIDPGLPLGTPATIQIDAEQMTVTATGGTVSTGGCSFSDPSDTVADARTYTVTRGANGTTATSHPGGADVSNLIAAPDKPGTDWSEVYTEYNGHSSADNPCCEHQ